MILAEQLKVDGKEWIKASFRRNNLLVAQMNTVNGVLYNPQSGLWAVPIESKRDFEEKMGDHLIVWKGDNGAIGGIPEDTIPSTPVVPGYKVLYGPDGSVVSSEGFKTDPWGEFQVKGFNALVSLDFLILADDAGLGKTWMVANAMEARKKLGQLVRGVVLCKASLLFNWRDEILTHTHLRPVIVAGTAHQRARMYNYLEHHDDWDVILISYETFRQDISCMQGIDNYKDLQFCIMDEAHKIKNATSRIGSLVHYIPFKYRYVLTATPLPNTPLEAYNYLAWGGKLSMNWWAFRKRYAIFGGFNNKEIVGYKNIKELQNLIRDNMLRRLKKDKLKELPEVTFKTIPVEMTKQQNLLYNAVKKEIMEDLTDTTLRQIPSALTKLLRLQQITDSPILIGADSKSGKLEALDDLIEDLIDQGGEKVIIFSRFREMVKILEERYRKYNPAIVHGDIDANGRTREAAERMLSKTIPVYWGVPAEEKEKMLQEVMTSDRQKEVYRFQNEDSCKMFIGTSPACREGLTLTAATHVIFVDCEWAWDYIAQAYSRAHRISQKNAVTVYFLVCEGTIDEHVVEVVQNKRSMSQTMLGAPDENVKLQRAREFIAAMV